MAASSFPAIRPKGPMVESFKKTPLAIYKEIEDKADDQNDISSTIVMGWLIINELPPEIKSEEEKFAAKLSKSADVQAAVEKWRTPEGAFRLARTLMRNYDPSSRIFGCLIYYAANGENPIPAAVLIQGMITIDTAGFQCKTAKTDAQRKRIFAQLDEGEKLLKKAANLGVPMAQLLVSELILSGNDYFNCKEFYNFALLEFNSNFKHWKLLVEYQELACDDFGFAEAIEFRKNRSAIIGIELHQRLLDFETRHANHNHFCTFITGLDAISVANENTYLYFQTAAEKGNSNALYIMATMIGLSHFVDHVVHEKKDDAIARKTIDDRDQIITILYSDKTIQQLLKTDYPDPTRAQLGFIMNDCVDQNYRSFCPSKFYGLVFFYCKLQRNKSMHDSHLTEFFNLAKRAPFLGFLAASFFTKGIFMPRNLRVAWEMINHSKNECEESKAVYQQVMNGHVSSTIKNEVTQIANELLADREIVASAQRIKNLASVAKIMTLHVSPSAEGGSSFDHDEEYQNIITNLHSAHLGNKTYSVHCYTLSLKKLAGKNACTQAEYGFLLAQGRFSIRKNLSEAWTYLEEGAFNGNAKARDLILNVFKMLPAFTSNSLPAVTADKTLAWELLKHNIQIIQKKYGDIPMKHPNVKRLRENQTKSIENQIKSHYLSAQHHLQELKSFLGMPPQSHEHKTEQLMDPLLTLKKVEQITTGAVDSKEVLAEIEKALPALRKCERSISFWTLLHRGFTNGTGAQYFKHLRELNIFDALFPPLDPTKKNNPTEILDYIAVRMAEFDASHERNYLILHTLLIAKELQQRKVTPITAKEIIKKYKMSTVFLEPPPRPALFDKKDREYNEQVLAQINIERDKIKEFVAKPRLDP